MAKKLNTANSPTTTIPRITEWTAPTGRALIPGTEFRVKGRTGKWVFVAYVDSPTDPHVECKKKGRASIRVVRPENIHGVSNKKGALAR